MVSTCLVWISPHSRGLDLLPTARILGLNSPKFWPDFIFQPVLAQSQLLNVLTWQPTWSWSVLASRLEVVNCPMSYTRIELLPNAGWGERSLGLKEAFLEWEASHTDQMGWAPCPEINPTKQARSLFGMLNVVCVLLESQKELVYLLQSATCSLPQSSNPLIVSDFTFSDCIKFVNIESRHGNQLWSQNPLVKTYECNPGSLLSFSLVRIFQF